MLYFVLVIGLTLCLSHPVCLALSLLCALGYSLRLKGMRAVRFTVRYLLPLLIMTMLINPVFSHQGTTTLAYLPSGNPLTLESIVYGVFAAFLLITVITWFSCFNIVMTSDKLVYLFGRITPALSLVLSMALRFVPHFAAQAKVIARAQRCMGRDVSNGGALRRARQGIRILSILTTWALENAIETADSMKSRGYGLAGRTAFSPYRLDGRDRKALLFLLLCGGILIMGIALGWLKFSYTPILGGAAFDGWQLGLFSLWLALCALPLVISVKEGAKWRTIHRAQARSLPSDT
jgi:energy-coupling factor transport system permease protein